MITRVGEFAGVCLIKAWVSWATPALSIITCTSGICTLVHWFVFIGQCRTPRLPVAQHATFREQAVEGRSDTAEMSEQRTDTMLSHILFDGVVVSRGQRTYSTTTSAIVLSWLEQRTVKTCACCKQPESGDRKLYACKPCSTVLYCGKECQRADWKRHCLQCRPHGERAAVLETEPHVGQLAMPNGALPAPRREWPRDAAGLADHHLPGARGPQLLAGRPQGT